MVCAVCIDSFVDRFGIAVGSLITARYTNRAEARADRLRREDAAISVASEWIKMFPSLQHVYKCLGSPDLLREAKNLNAVLDPGNWLEITAQRLQQDLIDRDLLKKMGLIDRMSVFLDKYDHAAGNWQTRNPRLISDYIPAHGPHLVSKYRRRRGRDMPSQNRLIEALDHSVDLLIKLKVLARSEKISSQSNEEIMQALKELDCRIAGMVVDPVPVEKSGIICTYCSTSVKVTLS